MISDADSLSDRRRSSGPHPSNPAPPARVRREMRARGPAQSIRGTAPSAAFSTTGAVLEANLEPSGSRPRSGRTWQRDPVAKGGGYPVLFRAAPLTLRRTCLQGGLTMIQSNEQTRVGIIAAYPDRESVERALRRLHDDGFAMRDVSVSGRGLEATEAPVGDLTTGDIAEASAEVGAVAGFLCGLVIGTAFLVVPGVGPVLVAGSLSAALAGAAEGAVVGAVIGGLGGALVGWGIPSMHVQRYERHLSEGRFLVLARTDSEGVEYTRSVLAPAALDPPEVYEIGVVNARAPRGSRPGACSCGLDKPAPEPSDEPASEVDGP